MPKIDKEKYKKNRKYHVMTKKELIPLVKNGDKSAEQELNRRQKKRAKKRRKKL